MTLRSSLIAASAVLFSAALATTTAVAGRTQAKPAATTAQSGWTLPADAEQKKSPLTLDAKILNTGKAVFKDKCQRCHGTKGLGDGPDADPDHQEDMDLTAAARASKNPDGVVFYKVMNGRKKPKMPAFKDELTEQQVWSVVAYAQSLRGK